MIVSLNLNHQTDVALLHSLTFAFFSLSCRGLAEILNDAPGSSLTQRPWIANSVLDIHNASYAAADHDHVQSTTTSTDGRKEATCPGAQDHIEADKTKTEEETASTSGHSTFEKDGKSAAEPLPPGHVDFSKRQLVMVFTCTRCETRAAKSFSKEAYTHGVVLVQCPGCSARHLIADNLGWFSSEGKNIEDFAREKGHSIVTGTFDGTLELTAEDILGRTREWEISEPT